MPLIQLKIDDESFMQFQINFPKEEKRSVEQILVPLFNELECRLVVILTERNICAK